MRLVRIPLALSFAVVALSMGGCLSVKSYVDPALPKVAYADFQPKVTRPPVHLTLEFQTQGKPNPKATAQIRERVSTVLMASQLFSSVVSESRDNMDRLAIVMNNVGDLGSAVGKGIGTGLTFGLAGSMVTDGYVFVATYTPVGKLPVQKEYRHAIHTAIGVKAGPEGLTPMTVQQAVDKVVEELVLLLLRDLRYGEHL